MTYGEVVVLMRVEEGWLVKKDMGVRGERVSGRVVVVIVVVVVLGKEGRKRIGCGGEMDGWMDARCGFIKAAWYVRAWRTLRHENNSRCLSHASSRLLHCFVCKKWMDGMSMRLNAQQSCTSMYRTIWHLGVTLKAQ